MSNNTLKALNTPAGGLGNGSASPSAAAAATASSSFVKDHARVSNKFYNNPINSSSASSHGPIHFNTHHSPVVNTFKYFFFSYFSYSTVRLARVHSLRVAVIFRLFQLIIFAYIIGWDIIYKKGYQITDEGATSTITTKVKGLGYVRYNRTAALNSGMFRLDDSQTMIEFANNNTNYTYIRPDTFTRIFDVYSFCLLASWRNYFFSFLVYFFFPLFLIDS